MKIAPRILVAVGSLLLLATAGLHGTGYAHVSRQVAAGALSPFLTKVVPTLWLFFSWHLAALGLGLLATAIARPSSARAIVLACAIVTTVDFVWVFSIAGLFAGTFILLLAAAALVVSGVLLGPAKDDVNTVAAQQTLFVNCAMCGEIVGIVNPKVDQPIRSIVSHKGDKLSSEVSPNHAGLRLACPKCHNCIVVGIYY